MWERGTGSDRKEESMPLAKEMEYTIEDIRALPEGKHAELIDGRMYMMASPGFRHQRLIFNAGRQIGNYIDRKGGDCVVVPSPFAVYLNKKQDYLEPDLMIICDPSKIHEDGCYGAPDWVMEVISPTSRSRDSLLKLIKYRNEGVREYWLVDPERSRVTVYCFHPDAEQEKVNEYTLTDAIPVGIYEDLSITMEGQ